MPQPAPSPQVLRFAEYSLDLRAGELRKSGHRIKLQDQPCQILAILLQRPGEVVTREELRQKLWSENTFVDFDHSLNTAVKKLRQALSDEAGRPRFIETLPRRGYRFIGTIAACESGEATPSLVPTRQVSSAFTTDLVGAVLLVRDDLAGDFVCLPIDDVTLKEKDKLEAADDNLGLGLLFTAERLLLVRTGTHVRVLEGRLGNCYEVRILEGEHTGQTAIVLRKFLAAPSQREESEEPGRRS
jgi:DNA-binding winged helix-turn-helix (wHTH) protein